MKHSRWLALWPRVLIATAVLLSALPTRGQAVVLASPPAAPAAPAAVRPVALNSAAPGWQTQLVDVRGNVGEGLSMDLSDDASGQPHIAYYDLTSDRSLKYATWDGVVWTVDTVDANLGPIDAPGLPLSTGMAWFGGKAHIVYQSYDRPTRAFILREAVGGPGSWATIAVAPGVTDTVAYAPALRRDPSDTLHLSYTLRQPSVDVPADQVIYGRRDVLSPDWVIQTVEAQPNPPASGLVTSLALNVSQPEIVYASTTLTEAGALTWAHLGGALWQTAVVTGSAYLPSIAVDHTGTPHIAFRAENSGKNTLQYGKLTGGVWHFQQVCECASEDNEWPTITINEINVPSLTAESKTDLMDFTLNVDAWVGSPLPGFPFASRSALAFDLAGNPRVSYYSHFYGDLVYAGWGPDWITRTVAISGDEARLAIDKQAVPAISYSTSHSPNYFYHVSVANWVPFGDWQYRLALPFSAPGSSLLTVPESGLPYELNTPPGLALAYLDDTDPTNPHLGYAEAISLTAAFETHTVDSTNGVGFSASMALNRNTTPLARPVIAYLDRSGAAPRIKLAVWASSPKMFDQFFDVYTDTLSSLQFGSPLAAGVPPVCCNVYIAYYDIANSTVRLATWDGTHWSDLLVDHLTGGAASPALSLAVDQTSGEPAIAYTSSGLGDLRYAVWRGGGWLTRTVDSGLQVVGDLSLSLAQASDQYPRIAYTARVDKSLRLAWTTTPTGTWTIDTVATFNTDPAGPQRMRVSSAVLSRDQLAISSAETGVVYAFRAATLPYSLFYNPLQPCLDVQPPPAAALGQALARVRALAPADLSQVDDLSTLRALRDLFALSPAGRHYIDLYYQHSPETGALALANPGLLWDAYRTLQNFVPGFLALDRGQGQGVVITQAMVDQANNIADRLVAAGSPGLGAAINTERAKFNHLQTFAGKTFEQAAVLMSVNTYRVDLPVVR